MLKFSSIAVSGAGVVVSDQESDKSLYIVYPLVSFSKKHHHTAHKCTRVALPTPSSSRKLVHNLLAQACYSSVVAMMNAIMRMRSIQQVS